jgi:zinc protease
MNTLRSATGSTARPALWAATFCAGILGAARPAGAAPPFELDHPPAITQPKAWHAPTPVAVVTPGGAQVVVLEEHQLPIVHLTAVVQAGAMLDPKDRPGLAAAVSLLVQEGGAGARTGTEVAAAFDELGGELEVVTEEGATRLSITVPSRNLDRAIGLLGDLLARPRLDNIEWITRARGLRLAEIQHRRDEPHEMADDLFKHMVYGDHAYAHSVLGTPTAVKALATDELKQFYAAHYGPKTVSLLVVGDATLDAARSGVERALAGWRSTAEPPPSPATASRGGPRVVLVDRPGAPQSEVRVGHLGLAWGMPDVPAGMLLDMVLGGSFTSRLVQNLREKHGYTYGAHSVFELWRAAGPFAVSSAIRTDVTGPALKEIVAELEGMLKPLPAADLKKGRALVEATLVDRFSEGQGASRELAQLLEHGVSLDFWGKVPAAMAALEGRALTAAAARLFHPDALTIVVIGDRKLVEPQLRGLPFVKEIELRDLDGAPISAPVPR